MAEPIPLTDTERRIERILAGDPGLLDEGPVDGFGRPLTRDEQQRLMVALVADARAAALAPIQALHQPVSSVYSGEFCSTCHDVVGDPKPWPCDTALALAAAGVDAAPNETTTGRCADGSVCVRSLRVVEDPDFVMPGNEDARAAVPSGHEQEGDHRG